MNLIADLIFIDGQVVTLDDRDRICQAVAIIENKIVAVGSNADVWEYKGDRTSVIALNGKSLLPGFIDSHIHMFDPGLVDFYMDCGQQNSILGIQEQIKELAMRVPQDAWIRGAVYDENKLNDGRGLTVEDLNQADSNHPVQIFRYCGHEVVINTAAYQLCSRLGIDMSSSNPEIEYVKEVFTGKVIQNTANQIWAAAPFSDVELKHGLLATDAMVLCKGVTSVHDAGGYGAAQNRLLQEVFHRGQIHARQYAMIYMTGDAAAYQEAMINAGILTGFGNDKFKIGPIKIAFIDGSSSAPSAAVNVPYEGLGDYCGELSITQEELNHRVKKAHDAGFQVTAHAVGDRAIEMFLDALELVQSTNPRLDTRHRIEHCIVTNDRILNKMKAMKVIAVCQPNFLYYNGDTYRKFYGDSRVAEMFPFRKMIDSGIYVTASSDCNVFEVDPLLGIHVMVNRKTINNNEFSPEQTVTLAEAIKMYTSWGAYASFEEKTKGTIEVGKLADLAILSGDIMNCSKNNIKDLQVVMTVVDGKIVHNLYQFKDNNTSMSGGKICLIQ